MNNLEYFLKKQEIGIPNWIINRVAETNTKGIVFGMSGGIDSSVLGALSSRILGESALGIIMPCFSLPEDEEDARLVAKACNIKITKVDIEPTFRQIIASMYPLVPDKVAMGNIKARLRMVTLYSFANTMNYLVAGSGDHSENYIGYFTKYGDSACDIAPLANLLKTEVQALGKLIGVPEKICSKPPSPGLWEGQTADKEIGLNYSQIDAYLNNPNKSSFEGEVITALNRNTEHKRNMPIIPPMF